MQFFTNLRNFHQEKMLFCLIFATFRAICKVNYTKKEVIIYSSFASSTFNEAKGVKGVKQLTAQKLMRNAQDNRSLTVWLKANTKVTGYIGKGDTAK